MSLDQEQGQDSPTGLVEPLANGVESPRSVADVLRAGRRRAQAAHKPKDMLLPGFGEPESELHLLFELLPDYEDVRATISQALNKRGLKPARREIQIGIETLLRASIGSYALIGEEKHDIGQPLGLGLYSYLFGDDGGQVQPSNDHEAIVLLFDSNTTLLMGMFQELDMWMKLGGRDAEEDALGN